MLIGALSDTHGRLDTTRRAVELLREHGARMLLHLGDVGSSQVLDLLVGTPSGFVFGNTDYDHKHLEGHAAAVGVRCYGALGRITLDGAVVSFLHGDDQRQMDRLLEAQDCDLLLHGHTHQRNVRKVGRIQVINPGALQRASTHTVATIDSVTREVRFIVVKTP